MKLHPYLLICILVNTIGCFTFIYLTSHYSLITKSDAFFACVLGWIFYLGIIVVLVIPLLLNKQKVRQWFAKEYYIASLILILLHTYSLIQLSWYMIELI
jgi:hypothetical protein